VAENLQPRWRTQKWPCGFPLFRQHRSAPRTHRARYIAPFFIAVISTIGAGGAHLPVSPNPLTGTRVIGIKIAIGPLAAVGPAQFRSRFADLREGQPDEVVRSWASGGSMRPPGAQTGQPAEGQAAEARIIESRLATHHAEIITTEGLEAILRRRSDLIPTPQLGRGAGKRRPLSCPPLLCAGIEAGSKLAG